MTGCKLTNKGPPAKPKILKDKNKIKDFLEEGAPSCAPARRGRRSSAITPCCPPFVEAGMAITFANVFAAALANWW